MVIAFCFVCFSSYGQVKDSIFNIPDSAIVNIDWLWSFSPFDQVFTFTVHDSLGEVLYIEKDSPMVVVDSLRAIKILLKLLLQSQDALSKQYKQLQDNLFDKPKPLNLLYKQKQ